VTDITPSLADAITVAQLNVRLAQTSAQAAVNAAEGAGLAAETVFHNFYYGILAVDPTTRPDLTPCQDGDLYYNSIGGTLRMRIGSDWQTVATSVSANALVANFNLSDVSSASQARWNLGLGSAAVLSAGAANGVATLGADGKVPASQLNFGGGGGLSAAGNLSELTDKAAARTNLQLGTAAVKNAGAASGVADLDGSGKVPVAQLPAGVASGVAQLDANAHVPLGQLMAGSANGIAQLDSGGKVPTSQLPAFGNPLTVAKSAAYTTISGDQGKVIWVTTGSSADVPITLVGANTAGDGATMIVAKADSGTKKIIVKDSDDTTNIAWLSNQFDVVCFRSNGSTWARYWARIAPRVETFTGNGTYTKPPLAVMVYVELYGAGGGGGNGVASASNFGGSGGGGGAYAEAWFRAADIASSETVTVPGTAAAGGDGGDTSFGSTVKLLAGGGKGGPVGGTALPLGSAGGSVWAMPVIYLSGPGLGFDGAGSVATIAGSSGYFAVRGGGGGGISINSSSNAGAGGSSAYGGGGGGGGGGHTGTTNGHGGAGGKRDSITAGGGGAGGVVITSNGGDGNALGVGGGGGPGGSSGVLVNGGNGGVAGGGGGGGSIAVGLTPGTGGLGGRGEAIVTTVFA